MDTVRSLVHLHRCIEGKSGLRLEAEQIFINTGCPSFRSYNPGLSDSDYVYLSEDLLDLKTLPRRLAIIGGGFTSAWNSRPCLPTLALQVTVIQDGDVFLRRMQKCTGSYGESGKQSVMIMRSAKTELVRTQTAVP